MSKLATKRPNEVRSILSLSEDQAEIWYAKPVSLGKISYRGGSWYTANGLRFGAARDAMDYLINLHSLGHKIEPSAAIELKVEPPTPPPAKRATGLRRGATDAREITVKSLIAFLKANPDVVIKP